MQLKDIQFLEFIEINHNNSLTWHKCKLQKIYDKCIVIVIPKEFREFFVFDEIKCRINLDDGIYFFNTEIVDIIFKYPQCLVLNVIDEMKKFTELRKEPRYNVLIFGEVLKINRFFINVYSLSKNGIGIRTKGFLEKGDIIFMVLYDLDGRELIYIEGSVVRKKNYKNVFEYGLEIMDTDDENMIKYEALLERVKNQ